jgi:hypothetical protein
MKTPPATIRLDATVIHLDTTAAFETTTTSAGVSWDTVSPWSAEVAATRREEARREAERQKVKVAALATRRRIDFEE